MNEEKIFTEAEVAELKAIAAAKSQVAVLAYNIRKEYEENISKLDGKMLELDSTLKNKIEAMRHIADVPPSWKFDISSRKFVDKA